MAKFQIVFAIMLFALAANSSATEEFPQEDLDCPQICPALYAPLCATDGNLFKEFGSPCELKVSNCRRARSAIKPYVQTAMDWCTSEKVDNLLEKLGNLDLTTPECLKPCAMIYAPVCVSNGKYRTVLSNECVMEMYNCALGETGTRFSVLQRDTC